MPTGGSPLSVFTDLMTDTSAATLTPSVDFVVESLKRNYTLNMFLDSDLKTTIQGGTSIQDFIIKEDGNSATFYHPNSYHTWTNKQGIKRWSAPWRYLLDHMSWTEQEVLHQIGSGMTQKARFIKYKDLKRQKETMLWSSIQNKMESALWAPASNTQMESASNPQQGLQPYSIPAFCNEATNGLFNEGSSSWTTVQGIDPTTDPYWKPVQVTYDASDPFDDDDDQDGVILGFENVGLQLAYEPPPQGSEYFKEAMAKKAIFTSKTGLLLYKDALRKSNDRGYVSNPQDPSYSSPKFAGFDVRERAELQTAAIYRDGSTGLTTFDAAAAAGPRYYFLCGEYLKLIFHEQRYFYRHDVREHPNQVGSKTMPVACWYNLVCRSRRRGLGILYPAS